ncbi:DnaJ domain-containing protein [Allopseudospirillum japonicum]|uniref:DnaJ domain-containing protein n=1 Tax=Allopseudospirillum japonicum TaxID=64971 RepID=A0A1H6SLI0_9GAMM|nr:DNA-J related domain-containing protein [Allopseudospirillum japonicum]SEI66744.1 DnaJ domain-containing protein [Allopseudospirillum japonicum]
MKALQLSQLHQDLVEVLSQYPEGINEHTLLKVLHERGVVELKENTFSDSVELFRTHFLLYNALYQLRDELWRHARGHLEISATRVCLSPYQIASAALDEYDPMRDYYLDMQVLEQTTREDIDAALNSFWKRFHEENVFASGGLQAQALATLGLSTGTPAQEIKKQYRRLAMRHHPDRGGDPGKLQEINEAMAILKPLLR